MIVALPCERRPRDAMTPVHDLAVRGEDDRKRQVGLLDRRTCVDECAPRLVLASRRPGPIELDRGFDAAPSLVAADRATARSRRSTSHACRPCERRPKIVLFSHARVCGVAARGDAWPAAAVRRSRTACRPASPFDLRVGDCGVDRPTMCGSGSTRVRSDSRCPMDADVRAGRGGDVIALTVGSRRRSAASSRELDTTPATITLPAFAELHDHAYRRSQPYPRSDRQIQPGDYIGTFVVYVR